MECWSGRQKSVRGELIPVMLIAAGSSPNIHLHSGIDMMATDIPYQILPWWTKNSYHSIDISDIVTKVVP